MLTSSLPLPLAFPFSLPSPPFLSSELPKGLHHIIYRNTNTLIIYLNSDMSTLIERNATLHHRLYFLS